MYVNFLRLYCTYLYVISRFSVISHFSISPISAVSLMFSIVSAKVFAENKNSFPPARARMADGADAVAAGMEKVVLGEDGQVRYL